MPQLKKINIQASIDAAAQKLFTMKGYQNTKIGDIAKEAGISVGNLYRYETGKDSLFQRLYPIALEDEFLQRIRDKMSSYFTADNRNTASDHAIAFHQFLIDNEHTFIILLKKSEGSIHEGFAERLAKQLAEEIKMYLYPMELQNTQEELWLDHMLTTLYLSLFQLYLKVMEENPTNEMKAKGLAALNAYHVNGMLQLMNLVKEKIL